MTPPVFVVDADALAGVRPGGVVVLSGPEGRHAVTVRRLMAGEPVTLVDGHGGKASGTVESVSGKETVRVTVTRTVHDAPPDPRVIVVQALPKGDRGELAVELLTEVGVDVIVPWSAERCVTQWRPDRRERAHRKWVDAAQAAGKQSRRSRFPVIDDLATTDDVAGLVQRATLAVLLDETASEPLAGHPLPASGDAVIIVGPEGGLTEGERERLTSAGAIAVRLGPSVLRTSSAGLAAVAAMSAPSPRWQPGPTAGMEG